MVDEELQDIEINLDDFNFDTLSESDSPDDKEASAEVLDISAEEFDLGDFSFDDLSLDTPSEEISDAEGRKEPFFESSELNDVSEQETTPEEEGKQLILTEEAAQVIDDFMDEAVLAEPVLEDTVDDGHDAEEHSAEDAGEESFDTFSEVVADEAEVEAETFSDAQIENEAIGNEDLLAQDNPFDDATDFAEVEGFDDVLPQDEPAADDGQSDDEAEISEAAFVEEVPEETPLVDDVFISDEEAEAAHKEIFGDDILPEQDFADVNEAYEESPIADAFEENSAVDAYEESFVADSFEENLTSEVYEESSVANTSAMQDFGEVEDMQSTDDYSAVSGIDENPNKGYARWFSGQSDLKMFELSKGFDGGKFEADEECKTLHINVGYDTYGWTVQFSDGVVMNLRDVREYQLRNGRLPNPDGRVIYGHSSLSFSGVERILIYESVRYFSYGA